MPKLKDILKDKDISNHWLETSLDTYDRKANETSDKNFDGIPMDYFRPSSAGNCPRALWYQRLGYKQDPVKAQSLRRMNIGTLYHEFMETKFRGTGVLVSSEEEVSLDDPPVVGHYDAIIMNPKTKEKELVELKSYANPKNKNFRLTLPKADHIMQWNLYSLMTDVLQGIIFYINKNDQKYKIYPVKRNERVLTTLFKKLKMVQDAIDKGERIPYQPNENHDWCNWKNTCQRDWFLKGE